MCCLLTIKRLWKICFFISYRIFWMIQYYVIEHIWRISIYLKKKDNKCFFFAVLFIAIIISLYYLPSGNIAPSKVLYKIAQFKRGIIIITSSLDSLFRKAIYFSQSASHLFKASAQRGCSGLLYFCYLFLGIVL